jgi:hypothetical protein
LVVFGLYDAGEEGLEHGRTMFADSVLVLHGELFVDQEALEDGGTGQVIHGQEDVSEDVADDEAGLEVRRTGTMVGMM